ncbi:MAG: YMGG-like glycine zipper-containing protein [Pseudomonadota bacterium]
MFRNIIISVAAVSTLGLAGCARNYAGEGAVAGAAGGAVIGAVSGGNVGQGALIGGAVGGAVGAIIKKDGKCYRRDSDGYEYRVDC